VGLLIDDGDDLVGTPDGIAIVRANSKNEHNINQEFLFMLLRSEAARLQLWTESGGTSYGKLNAEHILNLKFNLPTPEVLAETSKKVASWRKSLEASNTLWRSIGEPEDRIPIINSPILGLEPE